MIGSPHADGSSASAITSASNFVICEFSLLLGFLHMRHPVITRIDVSPDTMNDQLERPTRIGASEELIAIWAVSPRIRPHDEAIPDHFRRFPLAHLMGGSSATSYSMCHCAGSNRCQSTTPLTYCN